ncbi:hypothetical protein [Rhodovulum sp. MB263]|nr:hypothetical protein [Rhodovulum sp. MB263]
MDPQPEGPAAAAGACAVTVRMAKRDGSVEECGPWSGLPVFEARA